LSNILVIKNPSMNNETFKKFIIDLSKEALQDGALSDPRVYIENDNPDKVGDWFIFPMPSNNDEEKISSWKFMLDYIKNTNRTQLYFAGDFHSTQIDTGKKSSSLIVLYADDKGIYEVHSIPYERKLFKGITFGEMQASNMEFWWLKDLLDFWKNNNK